MGSICESSALAGKVRFLRRFGHSHFALRCDVGTSSRPSDARRRVAGATGTAACQGFRTASRTAPDALHRTGPTGAAPAVFHQPQNTTVVSSTAPCISFFRSIREHILRQTNRADTAVEVLRRDMWVALNRRVAKARMTSLDGWRCYLGGAPCGGAPSTAEIGNQDAGEPSP